MKRKRGVLKLWLAVTFVFVGLLAVVGATVLTLFLMGRFNEDAVDALDISFSQEFDENELVFFKGTSNNGKTSHFDAASDFRLTINTSTDGVTARKVTLSLNNGVERNGKISNGIITVPKTVILNRSFAVELNRNPVDDEIAGGIAVLTARSENVSLESVVARINVDVPVTNINVSVRDTSPTDAGDFNVVVGAEFTLDVDFAPTRSEFMFSSDMEQNPEKKMVFFETTSNYVTLDYKTNKFTASTENSGGNAATITAYTFSNSYYQRQFLQANANAVNDKQVLTERAITYFNQNLSACVRKSVRVKVVDVQVKDLVVENQNTLRATVDKFFRLTADSQYGDGNLELSVIDSNSEKQPQLFTYVGLRFQDGADLSGVNIAGGKIVKVNVDGSVEFDVEVEDDGATYYYLPNTAPSLYAAYYWDLSSSAEFSGTLLVNFFYQDNGVWKAFLQNKDERKVNIVFEMSNLEESPVWLSAEDTIDFVVTYSSSGDVVQSSVDLSELYTTGQNNVYRTVRHFIYTTSDVDLTQSFVVKRGVTYNVFGSDLKLYELEGSVLTITNNVSVPVYVLVATIKTDAAGRIVYDPESLEVAKYQLITASSGKEVNVTSMLSFVNMDPSYTFNFALGATGDGVLGSLGDDTGAVFLGTGTGPDGNGAEKGSYYLPSEALNPADYDKAKLISFSLSYTTTRANAVSDLEKIRQAYQDGDLRVVCLSAGVLTDAVVMQNLIQDSSRGDGSGIEYVDDEIAVIYMVGTMQIDTSKFFAVAGYNNSQEISMRMEYDDGRNVHTRAIELTPSETDRAVENLNTHSFYVYYQQPKTIRGAYQSQATLNPENSIDVTLSSGKISIIWQDGGDGITIPSLDNLIEYLTYKIYDQYGREINQSIGNYYVRLVEDATAGKQKIINFNSNQTQLAGFRSTDEPTETKMNIYVVSGSGANDFIGTDGVVTDQLDERIASAQISFRVSSESVSEIHYDNSPNTHRADRLEVETDELGSVTVRKNVVVASTDAENYAKFYIKDLVEIYLGSNSTPDEYVATLNMATVRTDAQKEDLMQVIAFYRGNGGNVRYNDFNSLAEITAFELLKPLNDEYTLNFLLSGYTSAAEGETGSLLYRVDFIFTFLANTSVSNNFGNYEIEEGFAGYLKHSSDSAVYSVFGGVSGESGYNLDRFLPILIEPKPNEVVDFRYSWFEELDSYVQDGSISDNGMFYDSTGLCSLYSNGGAIYLEIADVYRFRTVDITLRFGTSSNLALSYTFRLYVNPNFLLKVENPSVNLNNFETNDGDAKAGLTAYRATEYVKGQASSVANTFFSNANGGHGVQVVNNSENKFLSIDENGNFVIVNQNYDADGNLVTPLQLNLNLGSVATQTLRFTRKDSANSTPYYVDAIVVDADGNVKLSDVLEDISTESHTQTGAEVEFEIGFGDDDIVSAIFKEDAPKTVKYEGRQYVLLLSDTTYEFEGYRLASCLGDDLTNQSDAIRTHSSSVDKIVFNANNSFVALKVFKADLQVYVKIDAIVTYMGSDDMVFYDNADFGTHDLRDLLGSGKTGAVASDVSQELVGGKTYDILHENEELEILYVQTKDPVADSEKTYFINKGTDSKPKYERVQVDEFDSTETYYERTAFSYGLTTDAEIQEGKTYYVKEIEGFAEVEVPTFGNLANYYERFSPYGFHYGINTNTLTRTKFEVESDESNAVESLTDDGKLTLRHISSDKAGYVVLAMTISNNNLTSSFTYRYRIKVVPTFTKGEVTYPYAEGVEFLDSSSKYAKRDDAGKNFTYTVDLNEELNATNSRFVNGGRKRFADVTGLVGEASFEYSILRVVVNGLAIENYADYITANVDQNGIFTATVKNTKVAINVVVRKAFFVGGLLLVGGEQDYVFAFNQSGQYRVTIDGTTYGTTNTVEKTINAAKDFEIEVDLVGEDASLSPQSFSALITGEGKEEALTEFKFLEKGTRLTATDGTALVLSEEVYLTEENYEETDGQKRVTIGEKTYILGEDVTIFTNHLQLSSMSGNKRILTIKPLAITRDYKFVIHLFTENRQVFTINLTLTGSFEYKISDEKFTGGKEYKLLAPEDDATSKFLFSSITDGGKSLDDYAGTNYDVKLSANSNLVKIVENRDWHNSTVEFAYMTQSHDIDFAVRIFKDGEFAYSFNFTLKVAPNMTGADNIGNLTETINDRAGEKIYSENIVTRGKDYLVSKLAKLGTNGTSTTFKFLTDENKLADEGVFTADKFKVGDDEKGVSTGHTFTLVYLFNNGTETVELFTVTLNYLYTLAPNIDLSVNHPMPDKENAATYSYNGKEIDAEYIGTEEGSDHVYRSATVNDFFNSASTFAGVSEDGKALNRLTLNKKFSSVKLDYTVRISALENAKVVSDSTVYAVEGGTLASGTGASTGSALATTMPAKLNLTFELTGTTSGFVQFEITTNGVVRYYNIVITRGPNVLVELHTPNYGEYEEVYAEDLATYSNTNLFAENRIVTYRLRTGNNGPYYVKFVKTDDDGVVIATERVTISRNTTGQSVIDIGKVLAGFEYAGTYSNSSLSEATKLLDSTLYVEAPVLTSRVVITYADGSAIASDNEIYLTYKEKNRTGRLDEFTLSAQDLDTTRTLEIDINVNGTTVEVNAEYSLRLKLDFDVLNNMDDYGIGDDNAVSFTTLQAQGVRSYRSLFENFANEFRIVSAKTGVTYNANSLQATGGSVSLLEYGFDNLQVRESLGNTREDQLAFAAGNFHNALLGGKYTDTKDVTYHTGLVPRSWNEKAGKLYNGADINSIAESTQGTSNTYNFIVIQRDPTNTAEWRVYAQGANNDGNFVMMRVTYSIDLSNLGSGDLGVVESHHNILFKVEPNSSVTFRTTANGTPYSSKDEIINGRTYATNVGFEYNINLAELGVSRVIDIYSATSTSAITARMYGDNTTTSQAKNFTYTYSHKNVDPDDEMNYNTWTSFNEWIGGDGKVDDVKYWNTNKTTKVSTAITTGDKLKIELPDLSLGEKNFYIDFVNKFGYQGRFYFSLDAELNPDISDVNGGSLTENDTIAVASQYRVVQPETYTSDSGEFRRYEAFDYAETLGEGAAAQTIYYDQVEVLAFQSGNVYSINKVRVDVTLTTDLSAKDNITILAGTPITATATLLQGQLAPYIKISELEWSATGVSKNGQQHLVKFKLSEIKGSLADEKELFKTASVTTYFCVENRESGNANSDLLTFKVIASSEEFGNEIVLRPVYSNSNEIPAIEKPNEVDGLITLSGISAYAFSNTLKAIDIYDDSDAVRPFEYTSRVNEIFASRIDYYYDGNWIGGSVVGAQSRDSTKPLKGINNATLVTSGTYSFVGAKNKTIAKGATVQTEDAGMNVFVVPTFNSALFKESNELRNVTVRVTLRDNSGNETTVRRNVTIFRTEEEPAFANTIVADGEAPVASAAPRTINDTLEITLDPGETISFIVDQSAIDTTLLDQYKVVTQTNIYNYTKTFYHGIHNCMTSITENLTTDSPFYVKVLSHTDKLGKDIKTAPSIKYAGIAMTGDDKLFTMRTYTDNIILKINDYSELSGKDKRETIYFLFSGEDGQTYRMRKEFTVRTLFTKAEAKNVAEDGTFTLSDFYKVEKDSNHRYYMATLAQWASNGLVAMTDSLGLEVGYGTSSTSTVRRWNVSESYKFKFVADGAFVDEFGTITTSEDFVLTTGIITLRIYMKVAGANGNFENENSNILLGTFYIRLENKDSFGGQQMASARNIYAVFDRSGGLYLIPENYSLYGTHGVPANDIGDGRLSSSYTVTVGTTLDFNDILKDYNANPNKKVHIVYADSNPITQNNSGTYTFNNVGRQTVEVVLTYRSGTSFRATLFKITVVVYDDEQSEVESKEELLDLATKRQFSLPISSGEEWFEIADGATSKVTDFDPKGKTGIFSKQYLVVNGNAVRRVDITFNVYDSSEVIRKDVLYDGSGSYALSGLVDDADKRDVDGDGKVTETYTFKFFKFDNKNNKMQQFTREVLSSGVESGRVEPIHYYVAKINSKGEIVELKYYEVTYYKNGKSSGESDDCYAYAEKDADDKEYVTGKNVINAIKGKLELGDDVKELKVWLVQDGNQLETIGESAKIYLDPVNFLKRTYFVSYKDKDGKSVYEIITLTFYIYTPNTATTDTDKAFELDYAAQGNFKLLNLDALVREMVGMADERAVVSYYQFGKVVTTVDLQGELATPELYYVRINIGGENHYYLFKIYWHEYLTTYTITSNAEALQSVERAIVKDMFERGLVEVGNDVDDENAYDEAKKMIEFMQIVDGKIQMWGKTLNTYGDSSKTAEVFVRVKGMTAYYRYLVNIVETSGGDVEP